MLKTYFVVKIITHLCKLFGFVEKQLDKKAKISNIC